MNQLDDRISCNICDRKFNSSRFEKHFEICKKLKEKKRHVFDSTKQRLIVDSNEKSKTELNETKKHEFLNDKMKTRNLSIRNLEDKSKTQWREKHEEFIKTIRIAKGIFNSNDDNNLEKFDSYLNSNKNKKNLSLKHESNDNENLVYNLNRKINLNNKIDQLNNKNYENDIKLKSSQTKISKIPSNLNINEKKCLINKTSKINTVNIKKSLNASYIECNICGRKFNKAAAERHIPWCTEQQLSGKKNLSNSSNKEALARFRARNGYKACKFLKKKEQSVPNDKKNNLTESLGLYQTVSTLNGLNHVFNNENSSRKKINVDDNMVNNMNYMNKNLLKTNGIKSINDLSNSSSASSKLSKPNSDKTSNTYLQQNNNSKEPKSRVKVRLNQQQKLQLQRMHSNYPPKTPIMKFKEKFPNHNNKLIEFTESKQFSEIFKNYFNNSNNQGELNNLPKTVPGVRTGGISPVNHPKNFVNGYLNNLENVNDLEQLRARIKEMYLNSNENYNLAETYLNNKNNKSDLKNINKIEKPKSYPENNYNKFIPENSTKLRPSRSVNDFLSPSDELNLSKNLIINNIELSKICHQCQTIYATLNAKYCYECGARRIGTINTILT